MAEQPRTLLDDIGGPEVTRRAARHAIAAILGEDDPTRSVRPLFARIVAEGHVDVSGCTSGRTSTRSSACSSPRTS